MKCVSKRRENRARHLAAVMAVGWLMVVGVGSARGAAAPQLVSSQPAQGATGVAVTSSVTFTFNVPMTPNPLLGGNPFFAPVGSVKWGANLPGEEFTYAWSEDFKTVTCTYSGDLPANTLISWQLNPPGVSQAVQLTSLEGVALPIGQYSGSFTTGNAGGGGGNGGNGGDGDGAPELVSTLPPDGATAVPVTASVQFVFDQPMEKNAFLDPAPAFIKGAIVWSGTGVQASKFTYSWSSDGTVLTADYSGDLPGQTVVSWQLNPSDSELQIANEEGEPLASDTYQGSFTTGEGGGNGGGDDEDCDPNTMPDSWGMYSLSKFGSHQQTSAADPVPSPEEGFTFSSLVSGPDAGPAVTAASVTVPSGSRTNLVGFAGMWFLAATYDIETAMEAAYPAGNYTLAFQRTGEGERSFPISMPALSVVPIPKIANFAETQTVNPAAEFTLRWNAFTGANAQRDFLSLTISSPTGLVFQAPDLCVPRELPVSATSIVIPAGTLQPGGTYQTTLTFSRLVYSSTNAVPEMSGFASVGRTTHFTMTTTGGGGGGTGDPARFVAYRILPNGNPEMTLTGTAGRAYTLQRSTSLLPGSWQPAQVVTMDGTGRATFEDAAQGATRPVFYRAIAN